MSRPTLELGTHQQRSIPERLPQAQLPTIVVVDPRALTREGLVQLLETNGKFRILSMATPNELLQRKNDVAFGDVVILLGPGSSSIDDERVRNDIAMLTLAVPEAPIIIVCDRDDSQHVGEALRQGVRGYIPTTLTGRILVEAVRLVQAGGTFVPAGALAEALTQRRGEQAEPLPARASLDMASLTPRQREVLDLLRRGKPNKIIAHELTMRESTVKVHVRQIMRKLHASNRTQAAFMAARVAERGTS